MSGALASFRELRGVGPAVEGRLHNAGVYTWSALAEVLTALTQTRSENPLGDLARQLADRTDALDPDRNLQPAGGERVEAFILRIALTPEGQAVRSTVTHVRSQDERPWNGWSPDEVIRFVEERARVEEPAGLDAAASDAGSLTIRAAEAVGADDARPFREHEMVLDAGKAIGGRPRSIALRVLTDQLADGDEFEYHATLLGRALGQTGDGPTELGRHVGRVRSPAELPLHFDAVTMPPGVQRLRLRLALLFRTPRHEAPVLELRS